MKRAAALLAALWLSACSAAPSAPEVPTAPQQPAPAPAAVPNASTSTHLDGRVVAVADGDTLSLLLPGDKLAKIRLAEIDAPEKAQPFGQAAKQALSDLCFGVQASVRVVDVDRYGRAVGRVTCRGVDANRELVTRGMAWAYRKYLRDATLLRVEEDARISRRGLWSAAEPAPPWEWRRRGP